MKVRHLLAVGLSVLLIGSVLAPADAAPPQKFSFKLGGDCKEDNFTARIEEDVTYNCYIDVKVSPAKPFRLVNIQVKDADNAWQFATDQGEKIESRFSSNSMRVVLPTQDEDGVFLADGDYEYRVYIAKAGSAKAVVSKPFTVTYVSAGNAMADEAEEAP